MTGGAIAEGVAQLGAGISLLLDADFDELDANGFVALLESLEVQRRRLDAVDTRVVAATDRAYVAASRCRSSTADLLVHQLRVSAGEARARVNRARDLGPRRTLLGEPLAPIHPVLTKAQRAGEISAQQLDIAISTLGRIPIDISVEATPVAEALLATAARHENPKGLSITATKLLDRLDQDGDEPQEERNYRRRGFDLARRDDGHWDTSGSLTDETGLVWQTVLDALSAPAPHSDDGSEPDPRTATERRHDALLELGLRVLRSGTLPDTGGAPVTVLVRTTDADLADPAGRVQTEHGHLMRTRTLLHLAGDAEIIPIHFDPEYSDCRLMLGRTRRLANRAQRRALALRDGGCCFPGCDRPSSWTEVHHIEPWIAAGTTDIDNLCLLCPFHHREFERRGWAVVLEDGRPHWIPPRWIDTERKARRNTAHHLPEIVFEPDGTMVLRR